MKKTLRPFVKAIVEASVESILGDDDLMYSLYGPIEGFACDLWDKYPRDNDKSGDCKNAAARHQEFFKTFPSLVKELEGVLEARLESIVNEVEWRLE